MIRRRDLSPRPFHGRTALSFDAVECRRVLGSENIHELDIKDKGLPCKGVVRVESHGLILDLAHHDREFLAAVVYDDQPHADLGLDIFREVFFGHIHYEIFVI